MYTIRLLMCLLVGVFPWKCTTAATKNDSICHLCRQDLIGVSFDPNITPETEMNQFLYNATDIIPFVAKIASEFKSMVYFWIHSNVAIAAAEYNLETSKSSNETLMEVWMLLFDLETTNFTDILYVAELQAELANHIFPKTVTKIIYHCHTLNDTDWNHPSFFEIALSIIEVFPRSMYTVSALMHSNDISQLMDSKFRNFSLFLLDNFDSIIFRLELNDFAEYNLESHNFPKSLLEVLNFRTFLKQQNYNNIEVGIICDHSDTTDDGHIDYKKVSQFRKQFVNKAVAENMSLIIGYAFDHFASKRPSLQTTGWWRVVDSSYYNTTKDIKFVDKETVALKYNHLTSSKYIYSKLNENFSFDRNIICVELAPVLYQVDSKRLHSFNASTLPVLLNVLTSRFDLVVVDIDFEFETGSKPLVELVAENNLKVNTLPVKLFLMTANSSLGQLQLIKSQVLRANTIYSDTVTQVIFYNQINEIAKARQLLNPKQKRLVNIGLLQDISACFGLLNEKALLKSVDMVYFSISPGIFHHDNVYTFDVHRMYPQIISLFEKCKRHVKTFLPKLEVGFHTSFSDSYKSRKEDYASLAIYWTEISRWASKTNTTLLLTHAFDSAYEMNILPEEIQHMGWWTVRQDSKNLIFEDKREAALRKLPIGKSESSKSSDVLTILLSILIPTVLLFAVLSAYFGWKNTTSNDSECTAILSLCSKQTVILPSYAFVKETSTIIGKGNFGIVYKCYMAQFSSEVAVKLVRTDFEDQSLDTSNAVKCLLSELKVMSYVGQHENILALLGVCPKNPVYIVTEYCKNRSLLLYLREQDYNEVIPSTYELLQFCVEISKGMKYLQEKNVIHGDLSTRNVLLDKNFTCKISDFGLSRNLEEYEIYVKKGKEPLPWRWMAVESLLRLEFTAKSDIWAMGVTFWEIFTLGKLPYTGMSWNADFCDKLVNGL